MNASGHFDFHRNEYVITSPTAARPQENFLFNERYFACVHQTGNGFSKYVDPRGYATKIVNGDLEPAYNDNSRLVYIRDDATGEYWSVGYYPVCRPFRHYECRQGAGYTLVQNVTGDIAAAWRIFVPAGEDPVELWTLEIVNIGKHARKLSVFAYAELSLEANVSTYGHASYLNSFFLKKSWGVAVRKLPMSLPYPYFAAALLGSRKPATMDASRNAFVEQFRSLANPVALENGRCSGAISSRDPVAGALHYRVNLPGGKSWRCDFLAAALDVNAIETEAARYARKYLSGRGAGVNRSFSGMRKATEKFLARVSVHTPESRLDALFNRWIPMLIRWGLACGRWGMLGYRDIVQQAQGYLMLDVDGLSRRRLLQTLCHQLSNGHAVRSFPSLHVDSHMKYSDSSLWLIRAVNEFVKENGDFAFLRQKVSFLDGGQADVLEHLRRCMDVLWKDRGRHGLCRIHQGDWNDSLTHVGPKGRGESVWLSQAFCAACLEMQELMHRLGDAPAVKKYRAYHAKVSEALNSHAWDGGWYLCAYDDAGMPIGSRKNRQGQIFLNTQSWAMISKTVPPSRRAAMLRNLRNRLATPYGYMLHYPTYTRKQDNIGRLTCLEPGCSENASVYTHGNAFLAVALLEAGLADEAFDVICRIMPYNPKNPSKAVIPFQLSNGYGGVDHRCDPGKAQFGWSTGSGAWLHQAMVEYLFGLRRTYDGLLLRPCLPSGWKTASIRREFRGTKYEVSYRRKGGAGNRILDLKVNGASYDPRRPLPLDGGKVNVEAVLG
jgi:cellobiose phosphorylase